MEENIKVEVNDGDILNQINDSYLRKKRKMTIIISSIILAFVLAISTIIITFCTVKINTKPSTISEPTKFTVTTKDDTILIFFHFKV